MFTCLTPIFYVDIGMIIFVLRLFFVASLFLLQISKEEREKRVMDLEHSGFNLSHDKVAYADYFKVQFLVL